LHRHIAVKNAVTKKTLAMNGERRNSVDVINVVANNTCARFLIASVISLQNLDICLRRHTARLSETYPRRGLSGCTTEAVFNARWPVRAFCRTVC
jgi:endonuclease III